MNKELASLNEISSRPRSFDGAVKAFEVIMRTGAESGVSDVHIDPRGLYTLVRMRVDGILREMMRVDTSLHEELISHIKILTGSRTDLHIFPQDGRCDVSVDNRRYNIRASFMPTFYGENAVLRMLPTDTGEHESFSKLGFSIEHVKSIDCALRKSQGMILVTGPTGSGKTTTLRTCLAEKVGEGISVVTLEDPIEYEIHGARQIRVEQSHGVTFSNVLRSVLRQDPDVVMVGEIRDRDTCELAAHTALTGHLVLSTLHTNDAFETITRLRDMGLDSYILASILSLIVSQRLARSTCTRCAGLGCESCSYSGCSTRTVIAEALPIDEHMRAMIYESAPISSMRRYAIEQEWKSMAEHGSEKVEWGMVSRAEMARILG